MLSTLTFIALFMAITAYIGIQWAMLMFHHEQKALQNSQSQLADPTANDSALFEASESSFSQTGDEGWTWHYVDNSLFDTDSDWLHSPAYSHLPGNIYHSLHGPHGFLSVTDNDWYTDPAYSHFSGNIHHSLCGNHDFTSGMGCDFSSGMGYDFSSGMGFDFSCDFGSSCLSETTFSSFDD